MKIYKKKKKIRNLKTKFIKENHKLKNTIKELNEKIKQQEEKLSKRFILKTIRPGRTPNMNKTKISKPMSNTVRNYMKREFDNV